jgi:Flp pilus assembly protein TadD
MTGLDQTPALFLKDTIKDGHGKRFNKSVALFSQGKYDEANQAYDKAIRLAPNDSWAWTNKGAALKALGRASEVDAAFAKAKELGYIE